jgi:hypothetical protein
MKRYLFILTTFFFAISTHSGVATPFVSKTTSVPYSTLINTFNTNTTADTYLLLAHKWTGEDISLDLKINGYFEAKLFGGKLVYGYWEISKNQEMLRLYNDPIDEELFEMQFILIILSYHAITIIDENGKKSELHLN